MMGYSYPCYLGSLLRNSIHLSMCYSYSHQLDGVVLKLWIFSIGDIPLCTIVGYLPFFAWIFLGEEILDLLCTTRDLMNTLGGQFGIQIRGPFLRVQTRQRRNHT